MTVNQTKVLNVKAAKTQGDERHLCPLQLDVIERALILWSNPGDRVLSPFMGIGSEGYMALKHKRKFLGIELKESYWKQACRNLAEAENSAASGSLLDLMGDVEAA
jgi:DNA modification methylase